MPLRKATLPFDLTKNFQPLFLDYVSGSDKLDGFYSYSPQIGSFQNAVAAISKQDFDRDLLANVISDQYSTTRNCELPAAALSLLKKEKTFTVTTGHQLCLFTGPLYFIYKIISTINLAKELKKKFPENDFIPVYWMASEDHDIAEIDHIHLFGKTLKWDTA